MDVAVVAEFPQAAGPPLRLHRTRFTGPAPNGRRAVFISGVHGDELEAIFALTLFAKALGDLLERDPGVLLGAVDLMPAANVQAVGSLVRGWPVYGGLDMNRTFPGNATGVLPLQYASQLLDAVGDATVAVDVHASNIYLYEMLQVRMLDEFAPALLPLAAASGVDVAWIHGSATVLETTLSYNLNRRGVPTLVIEAGIGLRADREIADRIVEGLLSLLAETGVLAPAFRKNYRPPMQANDKNVFFVNAPAPGMFVPTCKVGQRVGTGEVLGQVLDVYTGKIVATVVSPLSGLLFTMREIPLVHEGSLLVRMVAF